MKFSSLSPKAKNFIIYGGPILLIILIVVTILWSNGAAYKKGVAEGVAEGNKTMASAKDSMKLVSKALDSIKTLNMKLHTAQVFADSIKVLTDSINAQSAKIDTIEAVPIDVYAGVPSKFIYNKTEKKTTAFACSPVFVITVNGIKYYATKAFEATGDAKNLVQMWQNIDEVAAGTFKVKVVRQNGKVIDLISAKSDGNSDIMPFTVL